MLKHLLGPSSGVGTLKGDLDAATSRMREMAHRVANATNGVEPDFEQGLQAALEGREATAEVDLEAEMVALANEQIRYDASADLLRRTYERLRSAVRGA